MRIVLASLSFAFLLHSSCFSKNADEFIEEVEELQQKMQSRIPESVPHHAAPSPSSRPQTTKYFAPNNAPTPEARAELMIEHLSENLRDLTGKIEKLEHQVSVLEHKLGQNSLTATSAAVENTDSETNITSTSVSTDIPKDDADKYAESKASTVQSLGTLSQTHVQEVKEDAKEAAKTTKVEPLKPVAIPEKAKDHYDYAYNLLLSKDLGGAQIAFKAFIKKYPNHELAPNAKYWLGETHYASQNFPKAAKKFLVGYQDHKTSPKAADNLLKLALSLVQLKEDQKACTILKKIKSEYPKSTQIIERTNQELERMKCK